MKQLGKRAAPQKKHGEYEDGISWFENSTSGVFLGSDKKSGYSFGVMLESAPEAACEALNKMPVYIFR